MELEPGVNVGWLLDRLKIPPEFEKTVLVNGRQADFSTMLGEGDEVFIFPPAAGG